MNSLRASSRRRAPRPNLALALGLILLAAISPALRTPAASFFPSSAPSCQSGVAPTDLINQPNDIYSWGGNVITWKMTQEFLDAFPLAKQQEQVRLAFREWDTATISQFRRDSPRYAWRRFNGQKGVGDLRTIMSHEIGHTLGSQHPDASWFNNNFMRNFLPDGIGGWIASAPLGGELMNEGNAEGFLPALKPPKGINGGEYNRIVSKDELALLDHAYNRHLTFQEVFGNAEADIRLITHNEDGPANANYGQACPSQTQGSQILEAEITINATPSTTIGFIARPATWEYTNETGSDVDALLIRTRGTDNTNPTSSSSTGPHHFAGLSASLHASQFEFEDITFGFTNPVGGSIPNGETVKVGLRLDVWDWTVVSAVARTTDLDFFPACLVAVFDWITLDPGNPGGLVARDDGMGGENAIIEDDFAEPGVVLTRGFRIRNGDATVTLNEIDFAAVGGLNLRLETMTSRMANALRASGRLETVPLPAPITLERDEEFVVILEGSRDDLPRELLESGNFVILDRPGLMDEELFIVARSSCDGGKSSTLSLLNTGPFGRRTPPCPHCPPGDLDRDGLVGITDLLALLAAWGACETLCPLADCTADLDADCTVGTADLLILLRNFN